MKIDRLQLKFNAIQKEGGCDTVEQVELAARKKNILFVHAAFIGNFRNSWMKFLFFEWKKKQFSFTPQKK